MRRHATILLSAVLVLGGLGAVTIAARVIQQQELVVRVVDAEGAEIPGAALSLSPGDHTALTNERGEWLFGALEVGSYDVTATAEGYCPAEGIIVVDAGQAERTETLELVPDNQEALATQAQDDISATLEEYGLAYQELDLETIEALFPSAEIARIGEFFGRLTSYEMYVLTPPEFAFLEVVGCPGAEPSLTEATGTATVNLKIQRMFESTVGGVHEPAEADAQITLVQPTNGARWLISGIEYPQP